MNGRSSEAAGSTSDLLVLVPDRDMDVTLRGLLSRSEDLGIRPLRSEVFTHPHHDPGVLNEAHEFLRPFLRQFDYSLVLFDREGCGRENLSAPQLEDLVRRRLERNGWDGRAGVVVLDPELEIWVWASSPIVTRVLGLSHSELKGLLQSGYVESGSSKPRRPKEAMEAALRMSRTPRSSSLYGTLAKSVPLDMCTDPAFMRLKKILQNWFSEP